MANKSFLGKGWAFPPEFEESSCEVSMVEEDNDIQESLNILLGTVPGERIMVPEYGCDLNKYIFEELDNTLTTFIKDLITTAILNYEPRITLNKVKIEGTEALEGIMYITIDYTIIITNTRSNIVYPFYLQEGTNIPDISRQ